ncbi:MAG: GGDEF domain-containing response regulator [Acidobacteriota bacterium]|nr:GGDEF domain-containing response regulator [Acidobacteriota bacterium]
MSGTARTAEKELIRPRDQGRILLVTDDTSISVYGTELERAGFAVVGVAGGAKALVALQRTRPHVVVADSELTKISADDLARMLSHTQNGVPLILIGTKKASVEIRVAALASGAFDFFEVPDELELLVTRVGQLVNLKQTMDLLRADADRDYLTGLSNRRRFRNALVQEVERWRRYDVPCALLLLDVDNLKKINDAFGHPAGDLAICHVANALMQHLRDNDTAARLGGEEFALLLAGADSAKAIIVAERLRRAIATELVEEVGTVTVSLGVAACPAHAASERELYAASDAALYRAKRDGKNRATVAESTNAS